jgi:hypothetical protein
MIKKEEENYDSVTYLISLRLRGLLGTVFSSSLKGLVKLKAMRARLRYDRLKFEKYLET